MVFGEGHLGVVVIRPYNQTPHAELLHGLQQKGGGVVGLVSALWLGHGWLRWILGLFRIGQCAVARTLVVE